MKENKFASVINTFKENRKEGKKQIAVASKNIFFLQKQLRTLAKKNEYCDGQSVANVAKAVRNYTHGGSLFDISAFIVDNYGRFCYVRTSKKCPTFGKDLVNVDKNGWAFLQPVTLTLQGVFNAFCIVASAELKALERAEKAAICEEEKAQKQAQKEAEKAQKIKVRKINELQKALDKGILTEEEYTAKVNAL